MAANRRRSASNREEAVEPNLTPMLDVVFIMLIFFIVTATFIKQAGYEPSRPEADTARKKPTVSVLVAISPAGDVWIDKEKVEVAALRTHIERIHAENPKGSLVIQADKDAKYEKLEAVINAARAAGVLEVAISTDQ